MNDRLVNVICKNKSMLTKLRALILIKMETVFHFLSYSGTFNLFESVMNHFLALRIRTLNVRLFSISPIMIRSAEVGQPSSNRLPEFLKNLEKEQHMIHIVSCPFAECT